MGHYACDMRPEWFDKDQKDPPNETPISQLPENLENLPQRLHGRAEYLRRRGHFKDFQLMIDAAAEIEKLRKRKPKDPIAPTWPRTEDQKAQSRPLILVHPLRHIDPLSPAKARSRRAFRFMHKHKCDTAALNGGL